MAGLSIINCHIWQFRNFKMADTPASLPPQAASMLECHEEPAIVLDLDYRILAANTAYQRVYGSGKAVRGRHCYEVSHGSPVPCNLAGESCPLRNSLESGQAQRVLHIHYAPRGKEHCDVTTYPVRNDQGEITCFVELLRPIHIASAQPGGHALVGQSEPFRKMLEFVQRVAPTDTTALLYGESGTGKELVAHAIHEASQRGSGPFVPLECSGLTETLFESELFGHEKGAFTGAHARKVGLIGVAEKGTLFLDEIGDVPLALQVKLLRLLETRSYRRVGGIDPVQADFRLVCATHRNLEQMVADGAFRQDLYYRLSAFPIRLPALRQRLDDLPLLIEAFLIQAGKHLDLKIAPQTLTCLRGYPFQGNIRELRNILERATLLADAGVILPEHLPAACRGVADTEISASEGIVPLAEMERRYLRQATKNHQGTHRQLADALGISERTLYRKLQKAGL